MSGSLKVNMDKVEVPKVLMPLKNVNVEELKKKYPKLYRVVARITLEDEDEIVEMELFFVKPKTTSFNRYIKSMSRDSLGASNDFVLDNIVEEQRSGLTQMIEEYPATSLNVVEKLLNMLGFAKSANFKKL